MGKFRLKNLYLNNKVLHRFGHNLRHNFIGLKCDLATISKFRKQNNIKYNNSRIKVVFLAQYIPAWNKTEPVYSRMLLDDRFEPIIVCVPNELPEDIKQISVNDTYEYFVENGYDVINAVQDNNSWFDLRKIYPDYVFYSRPYNYKFPSCYHSDKVSEYSKICMLSYAMTLLEEVAETTLKTSFYKDVYCYFAETKYAAKIIKNKFPITRLLGLRKVKLFGMPALEGMVKNTKGNSPAWDFTNLSFKVIWTPRWTTDKKLGGTNFFMYYESILEYAKNNTDTALLLRPHPLMFDNFIESGEMTREAVEDYCDKISHLDNVSLDKEKEYVETLYDTDVMVTDISGIMPEFFVTGKPVIFCDTNIGAQLAPHTKKMVEGCYVASSEVELYKYLDDLKQGKDPMKEKRISVIRKVFGKSLNNSTELILEELTN